MSSPLIDHTAPPVRALVLHPDRSGGRVGGRRPNDRLDEAVGLAQALDLDVRGQEVIALRRTTPATLFGSGKVEEMAALVRAAEAEVVVIDDALTPVQQRNLEKA
ncbi:MAG: GTPase HflX, partial [Brevundimonas sp.]|nr:GTPase HflX [Brevundimonas sp.]